MADMVPFVMMRHNLFYTNQLSPNFCVFTCPKVSISCFLMLQTNSYLFPMLSQHLSSNSAITLNVSCIHSILTGCFPCVNYLPVCPDIRNSHTTTSKLCFCIFFLPYNSHQEINTAVTKI